MLDEIAWMYNLRGNEYGYKEQFFCAKADTP